MCPCASLHASPLALADWYSLWVLLVKETPAEAELPPGKSTIKVPWTTHLLLSWLPTLPHHALIPHLAALRHPAQGESESFFYVAYVPLRLSPFITACSSQLVLALGSPSQGDSG